MKHTTQVNTNSNSQRAPLLRRICPAAVALVLAVAPAFGQAPSPMESLTFEEVAKLRRTQAMIFEPIRLVDEKSKVTLHLLTSGSPDRIAGGEHGARVLCFAVKPDGSGYVTVANERVPTSRAGAGGGGGAGKVSMHDISLNALPPTVLAEDGSAHLILAVVGYNIARTGAPETPIMLPRELFVSAQAPNQAILIGLLLPAVQKVR